jgi:transcriptional regulator
MYLPSHNVQSDPDRLRALITAHPLGAWVVSGDDGLVANHVPFLLEEHGPETPSSTDSGNQPRITLQGHVARANPVWRALPGRSPTIVMFQGPDAYITPAWYPSKAAHGKVVPTWNYAVVHAEGIARAIEDRAWIRAHVERLTALHEAGNERPWAVKDAPADYLETMLGAIVGIEIVVTRLTGKWKVSQNRPVPDRVGVVEGLRRKGDAGARAMADLVAEHCVPSPTVLPGDAT